jgi:hypothetical protein
MTTTTRTTRKAPWAAVLTALLAVLALVFGAMAFAGVANAKDNGNDNKPDNPGNSQNDHGQADGTHGNSDGTPGGGNTNTGGSNGNGPDKVWVCHADANNGNGQPNLGQGGNGGENKTGFNILYISRNGWDSGHFDNGMKRHPSDMMFLTEAEALLACGPTQSFYCPVDAPHYDTVILTAPYNEATDASKCYDPAKLTTEHSYCAALNGTTAYANRAFTGVTGTDEAVWTTTIDSITYPKSAFVIDSTGAACKITDQQAADIDAALGTLVPEPVTVAPVEAATVTEPEAVAVPAPATVPMPATVPAGDGSSVPQVPVALLALLALATAAAVTSGLRLATNR